MTVALAAVAGALVAAIGVYVLMAAKAAADRARRKAEFEDAFARQERLLREQVADLDRKLAEAQRAFAAAQERIGDMKAESAEKATALAAQAKRLDEQERHYRTLMAESETRFRELAQKVLEERSAKLKSEGEEGFRTIADGIARDIRSFRDRIESLNRDAAERSGKMDERIVSLVSQTNAVSAQANNLASAIRGDAQVTGEWGEMSLKRVLDFAGFSQGTDYTYQETFAEDETGRKSKRTDFVIRMTGSRSLVIDAKNTVAAIQELHAAEDGERRLVCREAILASVRKHVDEIAKANYAAVVPGAFATTLMYIPIEEVYLLAMKAEISVGSERESLREYAARKNVVFVNATSVVPIVKIVEMMWEMERGEANRQALARAAEELLSRANAFVGEFTGIGESLDALRARYEAAKTGLVDAPGGRSLAKAVARLVKLGVKPRTRGGKPYELAGPVRDELETECGE